MNPEILSLSIAAAWTGFVHCVCGPDHYVPFVAMSRVGSWSLRKTLLITFVCGIGHVMGSAILGFIGIALGLIVFQLEQAESARADIAAWGLFGFGVIYTLIGLLHALRRDLREPTWNSDGASPGNNSDEASTGSEIAEQSKGAAVLNHQQSLTPWILFVVFLFGPCEPLIPYLMVPAAKANMWGVAWVTFLFGATTLITMTTLVALIYRGTLALRFHALQRWGHAVAGLVVMVCGGAMLSGF
jgi:nickel/cobalt transporter (NicO) family protein